MKKKWLRMVAAAAVVCLSAVLVAGCAGGNETKSETKAEGNQSAEPFTLIVGFDNSYPPYGFIGEDGANTGLDLDLAQAVCDLKGWNLQADAINWDNKDNLMAQGSINCIWNGFTMEGREDKYTFSEPYMLNEQVIVVKNGSDITDLADLAGKTVVTQVDSAALEVLTEGDQKDLADTFASLDQQPDYNTAFMMLESGQADAVACDLSIAAYQMSANPDVFVQLPTPLSSEHYAVGFKKGETELANEVTEALKELYANGTVEELCKKYETYGVTIDNWVLFE